MIKLYLYTKKDHINTRVEIHFHYCILSSFDTFGLALIDTQVYSTTLMTAYQFIDISYAFTLEMCHIHGLKIRCPR